MKKNKYLLIILSISYSIFSMEDPKEIPANEPGIFLEKIVSEYRHPIRISQMPIKKDPLRSHKYEVDEDMEDKRAEHLAVVLNGQVQWGKREIVTQEEYIPTAQELRGTVFKVVCLRIEDLLKNQTDSKTYIWLRKYLKNDLNRENNSRGHLATIFETIEEFNFDPVHPSHTLVTLKFNHKDRLDFQLVEVESKTVPRLDLQYNYNPSDGGPL